METCLITPDGPRYGVGPADIQPLLDSSGHFWLDICGPPDDGATGLLRDTFGFHPLAVEDAEEFGQRPKLDAYDDFVSMIVYGATGGKLVEMHLFYAANYVVSVHRDPCPELAALAEQLHRRGGNWHPIMALYRVVDMLADGYFPALAQLDDRIDELEDEILEHPTDAQLGQLFDMKRSLIAMRKVVTPERDMLANLLTESDALPGMTQETERYFRDLYDHFIRISDLVDSYRDLVSGVVDTHLSVVSNRLNVVMKQLTIIATIFLPLSFLTGFFGQNFGWMVNHITSAREFVLLGLLFPVIVVVALMVAFKRAGWLSGSGTMPSDDRRSRPSGDRWNILRIGPLSHREGP